MAWLDQQSPRRAAAARLFDDPATHLKTMVGVEWKRGFAGGAEWMRVALGAIRSGTAPVGRASFHRLGLAKYLLCLMAAALAAQAGRVAGASGAWCAVGAVLAFYTVEVQFVFLFPASLDDGRAAWGRAWRLTRAAGGTIHALATVLPIAGRMLTGGRRGWCCGCLEVLLWYEEARLAPTARRHSMRLVAGDGGELRLRFERIAVPGLARRVRIAWISDLHLARASSIRTVRSVVVAARRAAPDVIVLGGDLVDARCGLRQLGILVRALRRIAPVWALPGNHDDAFGVARVAATVRGSGGAWLPGVTAEVANGALRLAMQPPTGVSDRAPVTVGCVHVPGRLGTWEGRARLVLAGHLHGGQFVLMEAFGRSWPAAFRYRWCGPRFELAGGTTLLVGRGAGDLLPLRWNCPREILCADLEPTTAS
jgi:predicted MPP superfamily phosphohydrolase